MPATRTPLTPIQRRLLLHASFLAGANGGYVALEPDSLKDPIGARKLTIGQHIDVLAEQGYLRLLDVVRDGARRVYVCAVPRSREGDST